MSEGRRPVSGNADQDLPQAEAEVASPSEAAPNGELPPDAIEIVATGTPSVGDSGAGELAFALASLVPHLSDQATADLRRLLARSLTNLAPSELREAQLGLLIDMVQDGSGEIPGVADYQAARAKRARHGETWPTHSTLIRAYGGHWLGAVRAAMRVAFDLSKANVSDHAHRRGTKDAYSRADAVAAVARCWRDLSLEAGGQVLAVEARDQDLAPEASRAGVSARPARVGELAGKARDGEGAVKASDRGAGHGPRGPSGQEIASRLGPPPSLPEYLEWAQLTRRMARLAGQGDPRVAGRKPLLRACGTWERAVEQARHLLQGRASTDLPSAAEDERCCPPHRLGRDTGT